MNVGIVTYWFSCGAGYVSKAYEASLAREHKVFIYARGVYSPSAKEQRGDSEWNRPNVTWGSKHIEGTGIWKHEFTKWIRKNHIEVIIFNEQRFWLPIFWAKDLGVKCGAYIDYYTQITVPWFAAYDFLICNTKRHYSVFKWHPQCYYIPWGVMPDAFAKSEGIQPKNRPLTFLCSVGWTSEFDSDRRGGLYAIMAFHNVKGDCRFKLYSQCPRDRMTEKWRNAIDADSRIELVVGSFSPFPYDAGDVYVYPSRLDGIGLTLPEALAAGLPAIVTDCAPMNEFVQNGVNGWTVPIDTYQCREDAYFWPESHVRLDALANAMQNAVDSYGCFSKLRDATIADAHARLDWMKNSSELCKIVAGARILDICDAKLYQKICMYGAKRPWGALKTSMGRCWVFLKLFLMSYMGR